MSEPVIKVEGLSKKYIIGHQKQEKYTALRDVIGNTVRSVLKPNSRINNNQEEFWALKDVNFEINQGDRVGIIGRNGAGKSTLLKVLSRITEPTEGQIKIRGRVASLLEVGTGFHPELTGRENIFLNGAILGMERIEIKKKFDEIVAFAEVEKFLDTPVKRYSSGMYVRLAFAVAAHLEPEILVVDEVLAVGDAQFQKKCLGKMEDVGKEGRTVLFVSHNMGAVAQLTNNCLLLQHGKKIDFGDTQSLIDRYISLNHSEINQNVYNKTAVELDIAKEVEFSRIEIQKKERSVDFIINYIVRKKVNSVVSVKITNSRAITIMTVRDTDFNPEMFVKQKGEYQTSFAIDIQALATGKYFLTFSLADMIGKRYEILEELLCFEISINDNDKASGWSREGILLPKTLWHTKAQV